MYSTCRCFSKKVHQYFGVFLSFPDIIDNDLSKYEYALLFTRLIGFFLIEVNLQMPKYYPDLEVLFDGL